MPCLVIRLVVPNAVGQSMSRSLELIMSHTGYRVIAYRGSIRMLPIEPGRCNGIFDFDSTILSGQPRPVSLVRLRHRCPQVTSIITPLRAQLR